LLYHKKQDLISLILREALLLGTELVNVKQLEQQMNLKSEKSVMAHAYVAGESCAGTAVIHLKELYESFTYCTGEVE